MRIHEVEIYSSKQIRAFMNYLSVLAEEKEAQEEQQKLWQGVNVGQCIGGLGAATQATPEYMGKMRIEIANVKAQQEKETANV